MLVVELVQRFALLLLQKDVRSSLFHVAFRFFRREPVLVDQIAADQCGRPSSARLAVHIDRVTFGDDLLHELHALIQLVQRRRMKDVGRVQLQELHTQRFPVLSIGDRREQLVVHVHRDDAANVLLFDKLVG